MDNKGFLFTILTILISLSIVSLASFFATERIPRDLLAEKASNVFDDVETDVEDMLGISASIERAGGHITVSFKDNLPLKNGANTMILYKDFIEDHYSQEIGADLTITGLSDPRFTIKPYDIVYGYPSFDKEEIQVYNKSGDAAAIEKYVIEIDFDENLAGVVNQSASGDLEVVINAKFANTEHSSSISVARNDTSSWTFNFLNCNCSLFLSFGGNMIDGENRDSSMTAKVTGNTQGHVTTNIVLEEVEEDVGVTSSIYLRLENKLTREDYIWLI
ncbi:MAG: hypothetical protein JW778_03580 [Candidatus Altiarchaeota archaeon]|nr:hypothetical protein [Candidatus Altiarchaeota archaeon]